MHILYFAMHPSVVPLTKIYCLSYDNSMLLMAEVCELYVFAIFIDEYYILLANALFMLLALLLLGLLLPSD